MVIEDLTLVVGTQCNMQIMYHINVHLSSSQDGGIGRNAALPCTTKGRITTNLKTINNQNCQKVKLHGTQTTKELKKHSPRLVGEAETGDGWPSGEDSQQGG